MERIGEEQTMTVKEVAEALGVDCSSVSRRVKELFPEIVKNGVTTVLDEKQVTEIKSAFLRNGKLGDVAKVENAVTEIEKQQTIMLAMQYLQENLIAMKERAIKAERKNAILMHVSKTYTAGEIAKELGMRSAQELNQTLADKGIQYKQNGTWLPTADNSSCGYFEIKQQELESGKVIYDRRITQTGREFILSLFEEGER
jgi:phage antirepressor YoqD-like protein